MILAFGVPVKWAKKSRLFAFIAKMKIKVPPIRISRCHFTIQSLVAIRYAMEVRVKEVFQFQFSIDLSIIFFFDFQVSRLRVAHIYLPEPMALILSRRHYLSPETFEIENNILTHILYTVYCICLEKCYTI